MSTDTNKIYILQTTTYNKLKEKKRIGGKKKDLIFVMLILTLTTVA